MDNRVLAWLARWRVRLGFLLGVAFLIFSRPRLSLLAWGGATSFLGLVVRAMAAGHLEKSKTLATGGPYRYTRNPLYGGSFLIGLGLAIAGGSVPLGVALVGSFLLVYWPVMRQEESFLRHKFGENYDRYVEGVPLFFPRWRARPPAGSKFQWERYRKNREYEAALGYVAALAFLALKMALR